MKKISILIGALFCSSALFSQEVLSLKQCREMALQYNKEKTSLYILLTLRNQTLCRK